MIELLTNIVTIAISLVKFVINTITSLISLFMHIPDYLVYVTSLINVLPSFVLPFATGYLSLAIILYILNRRA